VALWRILDNDEMVADSADMTERAHGLAAVIQQGLPESGIGPGFSHNLRAIVRADLRLIGLDDGVERSRIDIAFFGQDGLERAHAQLGLGQFRMVVIMVMMVVLVGHIGKIDEIMGMSRGGAPPGETAFAIVPAIFGLPETIRINIHGGWH